MELTFITSDAKKIVANDTIIKESAVIKDMLEDVGTDEEIPVPISSDVLNKILHYCTFHTDNHTEREIEKFHKELIGDDVEFIFEMIQGANFLNMKNLLDVLCKTIAEKIKGKNPQEIREIFGIVSDMTPEEESDALRECSWVYIAED